MLYFHFFSQTTDRTAVIERIEHRQFTLTIVNRLQNAIFAARKGNGYAHYYWQLLAGFSTTSDLRSIPATHVRRGLRLDIARKHGRALVERPIGHGNQLYNEGTAGCRREFADHCQSQ